jgi:hypothetical protein
MPAGQPGAPSGPPGAQAQAVPSPGPGATGSGPQPGFGPQPGSGPPPDSGPQPGSGPPPDSGPQPGFGPQPGPGPATTGPAYAGDAAWAAGTPPPPLPALPSSERIRVAWQRRGESDYIFHYWTALGWTILTLGIYGFYVFYQLVRRMRDHNARRLELLDAAINLGWEEAERRGLQAELTPSFQRAGAHLAVMRRMTRDFRDPVIWLVLSVVASGIVHIIAFIFLDQDLVNHDRAEVGVEYEVALIYGRFGYNVPYPDTNRVKGPHNYAGRIIATILSFGIYSFWWWHDMMIEPNHHFYANWTQEDALAAAVQAMI